MRPLTIAYRMGEASTRGYAITTPTDGLSLAVIAAVWRGAMPRGTAWSQPLFVGARTIKTFALPDGSAALATVTVTDARDEHGRGGIRHADVRIGSPSAVEAALRARLADIPADVIAAARAALESRDWELLFRKYRDLAQPRTVLKPVTLLTYPYTTPRAWAFAEACALLLATRSTRLSNWVEVTPAINPLADRPLAVTTLALEPRDGGRIVVLPRDHVGAGIPTIDLSHPYRR